MTKHRAPLSYDRAIARIAALIGYDEMARVTGRAVRTVRNWGDPDTGESCPIACAEALDLAFVTAGGDGRPMAETLLRRLDLAAQDRFADRAALGRSTQTLAKEMGEALAASIAAARESATPCDLTAAAREIEEAIESGNTVLAQINALRAGGGS
jgi:hypothetical protein